VAYYLKLALQAYLRSHGAKPSNLSSDSKRISSSQKHLAADTTHISPLKFHPAIDGGEHTANL